MEDLEAYIILFHMDIHRATALTENICPRALLTGVKVNYKNELPVAFWVYMDAYEETDNTVHT